MVFAFIGVVCCWALFVASCGKQASTFTPAPRTTDPIMTVRLDAIAWAAQDPAHRFWAEVAPTGSMEPFINEHSLVLCLKYTGQPLPNGTVAIYRYSAALDHVIHVVSDQNETSVYMSGYANHDSDGWHQKSSIEGFMVGQLYLPQ